jgi:hypothetical protein
VQNRDLFLDYHGSDMFIRKGSKDGRLVLWVKLEGPEYVIQKIDDFVRLSTYMDGHKAFGHLSSSYINPDYYTDGYFLTTCASQFEYDYCSLSKTTMKMPPPYSHVLRNHMNEFILTYLGVGHSFRLGRLNIILPLLMITHDTPR